MSTVASSLSLSPASNAEAGPSRKRAQRACDPCRDRRLKCEYDGRSLSCQRCEKSSIECTSTKPPPADQRPRAKRIRSKLAQTAPGQETIRSQSSIVTRIWPEAKQGPLEPRYLGSTSMVGLTALALSVLPADSQSDLRNLDERYRHSRVPMFPSDAGVLVGRSHSDGEASTGRHDTHMLDTKGEALGGAVVRESTILGLMHSYRLNILPVCPILSVGELCSIEPTIGYSLRSEDIDTSPQTPLPKALCRLAVCTLAALSRQVPRTIYQALLCQLTTALDGPEGVALTRMSTVGGVQLLLLLSLNAEMHSAHTNVGGGLSWLRVGMAIRMAQDLGLHRDLPPGAVPPQELLRRRRVWAACLILDRWYAISFGRPMAINLIDCDAGNPSIHADHVGTGGIDDAPYEVHAELTKMSILLDRVIRCAYTPMGLDASDNGQVCLLGQDIQTWRSSLPEALRHDSTIKNVHAGLLNLLGTCVEFLFLRAFVKPLKPVPSQIHYRPDRQYWDDMVSRSAQALTWTMNEGSYLLDIWFTVMYSFTWCFIVQLHAYSENRDAGVFDLIQRAENTMRGWASNIDIEGVETTEENSFRRKVAALISLLASAASRMPELAPGQCCPFVPYPSLPDVALGSFGTNPHVTSTQSALRTTYGGSDYSAHAESSLNEDLSAFNQLFFGLDEGWMFPFGTDAMSGLP